MMMRAKKRFGQNFLQDDLIIDQICASVRPTASQSLIEIGPGHGVLTERLVQNTPNMTIIELDRDLIPNLRRLLPSSVTIIEADVLDVDFKAFDAPLMIVGNLPYNISTPLLFRLFELGTRVAAMTFMLQKEVVDRMSASPNTKAYGRLSVMAQYHCEIEKLFDVPPTAFKPAPKVTSGVVQLRPHQQPPHPVLDLNALSKVLVTAFGQRRKTLRNSLSSLLTTDQLKTLDIDPSKRAETLSVAEYVRCANLMSKNPL
jgi:16S rRNA (adenine1518-N6/adenine1519-N6)-dimethyltransferase